MTVNQLFDVFVEGVKDSSPSGKERVAQALSQSYGLSLEQSRQILAGGRYRVKRAVPKDTAERYVAHLQKLGARAVILPNTEASAGQKIKKETQEGQPTARPSNMPQPPKEHVATAQHIATHPPIVQTDQAQATQAQAAQPHLTQAQASHVQAARSQAIMPGSTQDSSSQPLHAARSTDEGISIMHLTGDASSPPDLQSHGMASAMTTMQSSAPEKIKESLMHKPLPSSQMPAHESFSFSLVTLDGQVEGKERRLSERDFIPPDAEMPIPSEKELGGKTADTPGTPTLAAPSQHEEDAFLPPDEEVPLELAFEKSPSQPGRASSVDSASPLNTETPLHGPSPALFHPEGAPPALRREQQRGQSLLSVGPHREQRGQSLLSVGPHREMPPSQDQRSKDAGTAQPTADLSQPGVSASVARHTKPQVSVVTGLLGGRIRENLLARVLLGVLFSVLLAFVPASLYSSHVHSTTIRTLQEEERELREHPEAQGKGRTPQTVRQEIISVRRNAFVVTLVIWILLSGVFGFLWYRYV